MSQTLVKTSAVGNTPVMERYIQQHKEWQNFVCAKLTAPIERVLRDLYNAAKLASRQKGMKEIDPIFRIIVARIPQWTDDECAKEFADSPKEIDACIRMAVRAHAIVMALTISRQCKEIIKVPTSQTFFKRVLMDTAGEHNIEVFGSQDFAIRKYLRSWINKNIEKELCSLIPVSLFTEEDESEYEQTKIDETCAVDALPLGKNKEHAQEEVLELVCDDKACSVMGKLPQQEEKEEKKEEKKEEEKEKKEEEKEIEEESEEVHAVQLRETCPVSREVLDDNV